MTQAEWVRIFAQMRAWWPQAQIPDSSLALWYADLADHDPADVAAAVKAIYRDGERWPPNGAQILGKLAELAVDAPAWGEVKADLMRRQVAGSVTRERCPDEMCDGSGYIVDEYTRLARACPCRPGLIARRTARRANLQGAHPVVRGFLEQIGPHEIEDVIGGDRTAEAQVRAKYEQFVAREVRKVTYRDVGRVRLKEAEPVAQLPQAAGGGR